MVDSDTVVMEANVEGDQSFHSWTSIVCAFDVIVFFSLILGLVIWLFGPFFSATKVRERMAKPNTRQLSKDIDFSQTQTNLLIIDGCNGPIQFHKSQFLSNTSDRTSAIRLLKVMDGENQKNSLNLVEAVDKLAGQKGWNVIIYFDGIGVDKQAKWNLQGRNFTMTHRMGVNVTPLWEEADNVIVDMVESRSQRCPLPSEISQGTAFQTILEEASSSLQSGWTFRRTSDGAGRSRQAAKRLNLIRPNSVFSIVAHDKTKQIERELLALQSIKHLLESRVIRHFIDAPQTIVATDDIFLRQRTVDAGGLVMTFEQFWDQLVSFDTKANDYE